MTRRVTLSFDNGPHPEVTPFVLERLAAHGVRSTFFCLGERLEAAEGAAMARRALAAGHRIGNHTFSHRRPLGLLTAEEAREEFDRTTRAIAAVGETRRVFRPYGGGGRIGPHLLQASVVERMIAEKYTCVVWNVVPGDWRDPDGWLERAKGQVECRNWSLVVLHDIHARAMGHLEDFLRHLEAEKFEFREDFPPESTPIVDGRVTMGLERFSG